VNASLEYSEGERALRTRSLVCASAPGARAAGAYEVRTMAALRLRTGGRGATFQLEPAPEPFALPGLLALFRAPSPCARIGAWRCGSSAREAGFAAPSAPPVDAGLFGSARGGVPGREDSPWQPLFRVAGCTPPWSRPIGAQQVLRS
jgi:hypothetical protein